MKLSVDDKQVRMNAFVQKVLTNLTQSISGIFGRCAGEAAGRGF